MKIEELAATAIPNSIGTAKLATAGPPQTGRALQRRRPPRGSILARRLSAGL